MNSFDLNSIDFIIDNLDDAIYIKDKDDLFINCNIAFCNLYDIKKEDIIGKHIKELKLLFFDSFIQMDSKQNKILLTNNTKKEFEIKISNRDYLIQKRSLVLKKEIIGILVVIKDISSFKYRQNYLESKVKELENLSFRDDLNKIYNKELFWDIFDKKIGLVQRYNKILCFGILKIERLKEYRDIYGSYYTDNLIKLIKNVLNENLNRPDDYIFRVKEDSFALLSFIDDIDKVLNVPNNISSAIKVLNIKNSASLSKRIEVCIVSSIIRDTHSIESKSLYDEIVKSSENCSMGEIKIVYA